MYRILRIILSNKENYFFILILTPPDVTERLLQINPSLAREARPQGAGHEQVRAAHPGRDGNTGKVSASAYLDVGLSEYCLKSLDANLYQVIFW